MSGVARDTGFPTADAENDFLRARRAQVLSRLAHRLRGEPDDVNLILPFDEVVAALGRAGEHYARPAGHPARHDRRHGGQDPGLRPEVPSDVDPGAAALAAHRRRRSGAVGDTADRRLPDRRAALRPGRPPPGVGRPRDAPDVDRGLRHRGPDPAAGHRDPPPRRPAGQGLRAAVRQPGPAAAGRAPDDHRSPTRGPTPNWARRWRPGGSAACRTRVTFLDRPTVARRWYDEEYLPVVRMLREADLIGEAHRGRGVPAGGDRALPPHPHPRMER